MKRTPARRASAYRVLFHMVRRRHVEGDAKAAGEFRDLVEEMEKSPAPAIKNRLRRVLQEAHNAGLGR